VRQSKILRVCREIREDSTEAIPDQPDWSVIRLEKEYGRCRAVIGRYCSNLSRRPPAGKTCLSLTSRAVSSKATETPSTSRARLDSGVLEEVRHGAGARDMTMDTQRSLVRFATPYLEVETRSTSSLERTIVRELAQASHAATRKRRGKGGDQLSSIRTRLVAETRLWGRGGGQA
jgi:hypothetical protein